MNEEMPFLRKYASLTQERPFEYQECGNTSCQKAHLTEHQRTHLGQPLPCTVGESFSKKTPLIIWSSPLGHLITGAHRVYL